MAYPWIIVVNFLTQEKTFENKKIQFYGQKSYMILVLLINGKVVFLCETGKTILPMNSRLKILHSLL